MKTLVFLSPLEYKTFAQILRLLTKSDKLKLVDAFEREYLQRLLSRCSNRISEAARAAGLDRKHLYNLMNKHSLRPTDESGAGGD